MSASAANNAEQNLQAWLGRTETTSDWVTPQLAERLAATIESARPGPFKAGDELPPYWHSVLFPRVVPRSGLGPDGHPALGDFLPPVPLPKRMFAGKRIEFRAAIRLGDEIERRSTIASITPKQGASGPLVFVTVRHEIRRGEELLVIEEQDVVYRGQTGSRGRPTSPDAAPPPFQADRQSVDITADAVMVFRYSALCFNGHRIHYDRAYATEVEGYPALVVNGGLSTVCALEHIHDAWSADLSALSTRNTAPLFVGETFCVESRVGQDPGRIEFRVWAPTAKKVVLTGTAHSRKTPK